MKKTIITLGTLALMSFNTHCIYKQYKLSTALDIVKDMRGWMIEDINSGRVDESILNGYIENLNQVEDRVIDFANANDIKTVDWECDGYEVDSNGVLTNFEF